MNRIIRKNQNIQIKHFNTDQLNMKKAQQKKFKVQAKKKSHLDNSHDVGTLSTDSDV